MYLTESVKFARGDSLDRRRIAPILRALGERITRCSALLRMRKPRLSCRASCSDVDRSSNNLSDSSNVFSY